MIEEKGGGGLVSFGVRKKRVVGSIQVICEVWRS